MNENLLQIAVHRVGNKSLEEGYFLTEKLLHTTDEIQELLQNYFLSSFKTEQLFEFYHESEIELNEVYHYVSKIFDTPESLLDNSLHLAKHLYQKSNHPKIKSGELYVVYFPDYVFKGETFQAVGLFKSETKDTFLQLHPQENIFEVEKQEGINVNKLDKGCLVVNTPNAYSVGIVDNINKSTEAQYWVDEFLKVRQKQDEYYHTAQAMSMYKDFVIKDLPEVYEVSKADQAGLLNKSIAYFKAHDTFDLDAFQNEVIAQPDIIDRFVQYKNNYEQEYDIALQQQFSISESAFKKQSRNFKSVIKLDKNFHIYIHGDRNKIEQGIDEAGRKYYKIFYEVES